MFKVVTKSAFHEFVSQASQASFLQTVEMATLLEKRGFTVRFVGLELDGQLEVAAILYSLPMTGGLHMEVNGGPVSRSPQHLPAFYKGLQAYAKSQGALELIVKPYDTYQTFDSGGQPTSVESLELLQDLLDLGFSHDGLLTGYPGGEPDWLYVKDVQDLTDKDLLSSFDKKAKAAIKKGQSLPITLKRLAREELAVFKDITSKTADRRAFPDKPLTYYEDLYDSFGREADFMVAYLDKQAYLGQLAAQEQQLSQEIGALELEGQTQPLSYTKNNHLKSLTKQLASVTLRQSEAERLFEGFVEPEIPLAASLFLYSPHEVTYLFSGSYKEFSKFYAPALLQEYAMREAILRGIPLYNFLGITGQFDGSDGVLRFKQTFKGYVVRKMGTFRYYPRPLKAKCLQLIKKLLRR